MLISKREWARHERQLDAALKRAELAESRLEAERQRMDARSDAERAQFTSTVVQLTSRVLTKHGAYGLPEPEAAPLPHATPRTDGFIREPTEEDLIYREMLINDALAHGQTEDDAVKYWNSVMQGRPVTISDSEQ